jgi:hypothetical protein
MSEGFKEDEVKAFAEALTELDGSFLSTQARMAWNSKTEGVP